MTPSPSPQLAEMYTLRRNRIAEALAQILLASEKLPAQPRDWAIVGTLGHVAELLELAATDMRQLTNKTT